MAFLLFHLMLSLSYAGGLKGLSKGAVAGLAVEVTGDDATADPGDRMYITLDFHDQTLGQALAASEVPGTKLFVQVGFEDAPVWGYSFVAQEPDLSARTLRLPILPDAADPYPNESPGHGTMTIPESLRKVGTTRREAWVRVTTALGSNGKAVTLGQAPFTWAYDDASRAKLEEEQKQRFQVANAATAVWPAASSQDAAVKKIAASLVGKSLDPGQQLLNWNLGASSWLPVRSGSGVVIRDLWRVHVGWKDAGSYVFELSGSDGELTATRRITVNVK